ncbi:MAG: hypothetical protein D9C04_00070 [Nitrosopumilus sp. B06]|nr:MAG: hypothetical protein D9C04_00070 [Nitrosopumilus sp. B06]
MSGRNWLGGVCLRNGGYVTILESLAHYRRRLCTLGDSPELKNAAMFAPVLTSQAAKTIPEIDRTTQDVLDYLAGGMVDIDVAFLDKALACHDSDIRKAQDSGDEYYTNLIGDMERASFVLEMIASVRKGISEYD